MFIEHTQYKNASPFPHAIIEDFFNDEDLTACVKSIEDNIDDLRWNQRDYKYQVNKKWLEDPRLMPDQVKKILWQLHSAEFLYFLKELTGISGIIDDPLNIGGGIHSTERGGKLNIHKDFNYNKETSLVRKINVLVFLNKEWPSEWNGNLELWSKDRKNKIVDIPPTFNKMVIFDTDEESWHGCPRLIKCPENRRRLSLATYYYVYKENVPKDQQRLYSEFYEVNK